MGRYNVLLCGNLQSHASSEIRPWPDDADDNDAAGASGKEGVDFGSQGACSPR